MAVLVTWCIKMVTRHGAPYRVGLETYLPLGCKASTCRATLGSACYCTRRTGQHGSLRCPEGISDCCRASGCVRSPGKTSLHEMAWKNISQLEISPSWTLCLLGWCRAGREGKHPESILSVMVLMLEDKAEFKIQACVHLLLVLQHPLEEVGKWADFTLYRG